MWLIIAESQAPVYLEICPADKEVRALVVG